MNLGLNDLKKDMKISKVAMEDLVREVDRSVEERVEVIVERESIRAASKRFANKMRGNVIKIITLGLGLEEEDEEDGVRSERS
jgi:2-hydroxy-3-keto-5-methylthiopentenyl-1-phosphate phosphatase